MTAVDSSSGNNNGTLVGIDPNASWVSGKRGGAIDFSTFSGYVDVGNSSSLNPSTEMSIAAWIKPRSYGYGFAAIVERLYGSSYSLYMNSFGSNLTFNIGGVDLESDQSIIQDNVWQHVVVTYDGNDVVFYMNGVASGQVNYPTPIGTDSNVVSIGSDSSLAMPFDGSIDDVQIYNRALTLNEVRYVMQGGRSARQGATPKATGEVGEGLVAWYTMDGRDVNWASGVVSDKSGYGNNGYVVNMSTTSAPIDGKIGQGLTFDGIDDHIDLTDISFGGTNPISICAWIRPDSLSGNLHIISQGSEIVLRLIGTSLEWILNSFSSDDRVAVVSSGVTVGHWYLICGIYDGNVMTAYINTVYKGSVIPVGTYADVPNHFDIGSLGNGGSGFWNGTIDDVRIYNRAIGTSTMQKLYTAGKITYSASQLGADSLLEGLSGWWTFDGKDVDWASGRVADRSGLGNSAYIVGMSTTTAPTGGKIGQGFAFDGVNDFVDVPVSLGTVRTISFWVSSDTLTQKLINLSGTANIEVSGGTISTTGITSPTIYIDGVVSSALPNSKWHQVIITSSAGVSASAFEIGRITASYFAGTMDDVRTWDRVLTASEIAKLYQASR
jgi:hypothetical protein